jgi:hypothetical protein
MGLEGLVSKHASAPMAQVAASTGSGQEPEASSVPAVGSVLKFPLDQVQIALTKLGRHGLLCRRPPYVPIDLPPSTPVVAFGREQGRPGASSDGRRGTQTAARSLADLAQWILMRERRPGARSLQVAPGHFIQTPHSSAERFLTLILSYTRIGYSQASASR